MIKIKKSVKQLPLPISAIPFAISIKTDARIWNKWNKLKSEIGALQEKANELENQMGFPDASNLAAKYNVRTNQRLTGIVCDKFGKLLGKFSCYYVKAFEMPGTWKRRIY